MNINDIRDSGLLEQYALGMLTASEMVEVDSYLSEFPELKNDLFEIEYALKAIAASHGITPKSELENQIVEYVKSNALSKPISKSTNKGSTGIWNVASLVIGILGIAALWFANNKSNEANDLNTRLSVVQSECDSIQSNINTELGMYKDLTSFGTRVIDFTPTENYQETELRFHTNPETKKNYIQINGLPVVEAGQAFQLWSLKAGQDPIPLDVFTNENGLIVPVQYEEGTSTYAITIEKAEGVLVPTLERLIGTAGV